VETLGGDMTTTERVKHKLALKNIVEQSESMSDCVDRLLANNLCISKAEAKRVYFMLKDKKDAE
jgi:hypothetical protein